MVTSSGVLLRNMCHNTPRQRLHNNCVVIPFSTMEVKEPHNNASKKHELNTVVKKYMLMLHLHTSLFVLAVCESSNACPPFVDSAPISFEMQPNQLHVPK